MKKYYFYNARGRRKNADGSMDEFDSSGIASAFFWVNPNRVYTHIIAVLDKESPSMHPWLTKLERIK